VSGGLAEAVRAQGRVTRAEHTAATARADRDATFCRLSLAGFSYRQIATATSLSLSAVGKIITKGKGTTT
jgi:hypothetical protein